MTTTVVLTGVGRDRVGIVAELAQILFEMGCNLLDSSMTLLRGEFAIIVMVDVPPNLSIDELESRLIPLTKELGMHITVRALTDSELKEKPASENQFIVSVYGADRPGIVARVTRALAANHMNITDVQTKSIGTVRKIFVMILEVSAPPGTFLDRLQTQMQTIACELGVDITVQALDVVEL